MAINRNARIERESKTVSVMVALYCKKHHRKGGLCGECAGLTAYALARLKECPFKEGKTVCSKCPVHCYESEMRENIRKVMRFSGPRMIYHHPVMAVFHIIDKRRNKPVRLPGNR